ncbi:floricaula/leafy homolog [Striga asiatica]|uniref:Floricaula/leafy-like transcription factor n=1 Tax=Striga asiatica TaxID=4170 RepID=A0A5A7PIJ1_STRAF|nr:floricaula/leafy homolog [Striga asiatica]
MDPNGNNMLRWEAIRVGSLGGLEELFEAYGVRYYTAAKIGELGFTASTLLDMKDEELDQMMDTLSHIFRWDLLVGERYGIKAAVRAHRRRQQGFVEKHNKEAAGGSRWEMVGPGERNPRMKKNMNNDKRRASPMAADGHHDNESEATGDDDNYDEINGGAEQRQREHPFIVTEPGEVARGKKNGLDYLFYLYELCRDLLIQVQNIAREKGEKCPTKVTNEVFRYAKSVGANHINKPKMRHYVHCYALHCLDQATSDNLRRAFKERRENVGAWRQACYMPLVAIAAARHGWDIDALFNTHSHLSIWYVPTKLRQLCHAERSNAASTSGDNLPPF